MFECIFGWEVLREKKRVNLLNIRKVNKEIINYKQAAFFKLDSKN